MKRVYFPTVRSAACVLLGACVMHGAQAFEGGVAAFPAGSTGEFIAAFPTIPGLFAVEQFNYSSSQGLYDNNGKKLPIPFKSSAYSATTRVLAAWPVQWLGARLYSQVVLPVVSLNTDIAGHSETHNGLSNVSLSPMLLRWDVARHTNMIVGLDIALKSGSYSPSRPSVAVGYTSWQPVIAIRHNDPDGLDLGLSNRFLINAKNGDTGYRSGTGYIADFIGAWHVGKWKFGAVGSYMNQFTDDRQNGVDITGNRARSFTIGPTIAYDGGSFTVNMNYQRGLYAANTSKSNAVWINFAAPIWIAGR